jgi:toxin ParE1/3/4
VPLEVFKQHRARADLLEIWFYTSDKWGQEQADHYLDELDRAMLRLGDNPYLGSDASEVRAGYRKIAAGRHRVYYAVSDVQIDIIRVIHPSKDVTTEFDD